MLMLQFMKYDRALVNLLGNVALIKLSQGYGI